MIQERSEFRLVPTSGPKTASIQDTANSFGLHDTLQYGPRSLSTEITSNSALKERLENVCLSIRSPSMLLKVSYWLLVGGDAGQLQADTMHSLAIAVLR